MTTEHEPTANKPVFELVKRTDDPKAHEAIRGNARGRLAARELPPSLHDHKLAARHYRASPGLLMSINMAINVGAPLLLTGEPGTGKTQVAEYLGWYFDIEVFKYAVKSTSSAEDLRYDYDAVGYLHWAQSQKGNGPLAEDTGDKEPTDDPLAATARQRSQFLSEGQLWLAYQQDQDSILLIDEIDKAPRDFPNDLLHELDQHSFPHPFLKHEIKPKSGRPPIVIITSNDERRLPDAFLRRCIYHRIELTENLVNEAVRAHVGSFPNLDEAARIEAVTRFWKLWNQAQEKKPTTAELLVWLCILSARGVDADTLRDATWDELPGINAMLKDRADFENLG